MKLMEFIKTSYKLITELHLPDSVFDRVEGFCIKYPNYFVYDDVLSSEFRTFVKKYKLKDPKKTDYYWDFDKKGIRKRKFVVTLWAIKCCFTGEYKHFIKRG
jgi:hypothetical protein